MGFKNIEIVDKRKNMTDIVMRNLFYVVHLVVHGNATHQLINVVAANDRADLQEGLAAIEGKVKSGYGAGVRGSSVARPVFIRNLFADNREVIESCDACNLSDNMISSIQNEPDPLRYLVLGFSVKEDSGEKESLLLTEVRAENALIAINRVTIAVQNQADCSFQPLFASVKSRMTFEMFERYNISAKQLSAFIEVTCPGGAMVH